MTLRKLVFATTAVAIVSMFSAANAKAASFDHIDRLALRTQKQAAQLFHEFRIHYRHMPGYRHLMHDARDMYYSASHIHELAHHHGNLLHMKRDLSKLDSLFHRIEDLVDDIEARVGRCNHHSLHGHRTCGCDVFQRRKGHLFSLMRRIEDNIHHLQDDIEEMLRCRHRNHVDHDYGVPFESRFPSRPQPNVGFRIGGTKFHYDGRRLSFGR